MWEWVIWLWDGGFEDNELLVVEGYRDDEADVLFEKSVFWIRFLSWSYFGVEMGAEEVAIFKELEF